MNAPVGLLEDRGFISPTAVLGEEQARKIHAHIEREVVVEKSSIYSDTPEDAQYLIKDLLYRRDRHLDVPLIYELGTLPKIVDAVRTLLGDDVMLWRSDIFEVQPGRPATAWHQDKSFLGSANISALLDEEGELASNVTVWLALTDADASSGALQYVSGSHKLGLIKERKATRDGIFGRNSELDLPEGWLSEQEQVRVDMKPGEFVAHTELTLHRATPEPTERRVAIGLRYARSHAVAYPFSESPHGLDLSRYGALLVSGKAGARTRFVDPPKTQGPGIKDFL